MAYTTVAETPAEQRRRDLVSQRAYDAVAGWKPMRAAFVALIKEENFYSSRGKQSLRASWAGAQAGFADPNLQRRYEDFTAGWKARSK